MTQIVPSSFRDPSGFLFISNGQLYRQVDQSYRDNYDLLMSSGLYQELVDRNLLVSHIETDISLAVSPGAYKVLQPEMVPFISYPYEWSFSQLKDAALATLEIQKLAFEHGMTLKDASAYNIQFLRGHPTLIDSLSFEKANEGSPWTPYKQFCQHFLAPLMLMSLKDVRLNQLLRIYIDGIPLDLASPMLPYRTRLSFSTQLHMHLHAKSQKYYSDRIVDKSKHKASMSRQSLLGLIDSLQSLVSGLKWSPKGTEWAEYYQDDSYTPDALEHKKELVCGYLDSVRPKSVWDFGANNGMFSRLASDKGAMTVSFDIDPACVEMNYLQSVANNETRLLPLLLDLTNPSPNLGWANQERLSVTNRGPVDLIMALALIHHLAISNNVPLARIAEFLASTCTWLIIEFVPKTDAKVMKLLATREDVFPGYTQAGFENDFCERFSVVSSDRIRGSERTLYLMRRR